MPPSVDRTVGVSVSGTSSTSYTSARAVLRTITSVTMGTKATTSGRIVRNANGTINTIGKLMVIGTLPSEHIRGDGP